jgi:hypothetical protein
MYARQAGYPQIVWAKLDYNSAVNHPGLLETVFIRIKDIY